MHKIDMKMKNTEVMDPETDVQLDADINELINPTKQIIVYNDDVNSFPYVIETFKRVLQYTSHQAEQCAIIIHYNGKCSVKSGSMEKLLPICEALLENHITAEIQ